MRPKSFMVVAGEASGDLLAAELVRALKERLAKVPPPSTSENQPLQATLAPRFFGAGGPGMAEAGVELSLDLTQHSVVGYLAVFRNLSQLRRLLLRLVRLACERQPDVIICVDYSGFNSRLAHAIRKRIRNKQDWFHDWQPRIVQYVSPQVWGWRGGRVHRIAEDYDLVLSIFPFERDWYARRAPGLRVDFVGNPVIDRFGTLPQPQPVDVRPVSNSSELVERSHNVVLLPGSRRSEMERHLPVMTGALAMMRTVFPNLRARIVVPNEGLLRMVRENPKSRELEVQVGGLPDALRHATIAIASTGTVTVECACLGVPAVAIYKMSWLEYIIGKRLATTRYLAMPNILAGEEVYPELLAHMATPGTVARAALELLRDEPRRIEIKWRLAKIVASLGSAGASGRASEAILSLLTLVQL